MSHWIEFVAAIIFGAFAGKYLPEWSEQISRSIRQSAAQRVLESSNKAAILQWLIEYYSSRGRATDLYRASLGDRQVMIPFLTKSEFTVPYPILTRRTADKVLELITEPSMRTFPVDRQEILRRIRVGKKSIRRPRQ